MKKCNSKWNLIKSTKNQLKCIKKMGNLVKKKSLNKDKFITMSTK